MMAQVDNAEARETALVVDDEPQIRRVVRHALEGVVSRTFDAATGAEAIDVAASRRPDLIVLDLGLPDLEGREVCREIRKWSTAPIIVLSARHSDQEKVALLDVGADDYVTKPFSAIELRARASAQLRRARLAAVAGPTQALQVGGVSIDLAKPSLKKDGTVIHLTKTEWDILRTLVRHAGRTLTHQQIFRAVWGNPFGDMQQNLRVHIRSLRRKIESDPVRPALIITEPGVGYRFESEP
jgi:two-component system KDP operon response regulator KdpE